MGSVLAQCVLHCVLVYLSMCCLRYVIVFLGNTKPSNNIGHYL